jgi:hypothetical protein
MSIKTVKDQARRAIHETFAESALYRDTLTATPVPCTVRITMTPLVNDVGDLGGLSGIGNSGFASTGEREYRLTFLREEIDPVRGAVVEIIDGITFRVERVNPPYGLTVEVEVEVIR